MKLYLVRHAQRDFGLKFDQLNSLGIKEAKRLASYFKNKKIDIVYCSPNKRAKETYKYIKPVFKNVLIVFTKKLKQHAVPEEVGKEAYKILKLKEKRETQSELNKRVKSFFEFLKKKHKNDIILVISHKEVLTLLVNNLSKKKVYIPSASVSIFNFDKNFKIKSFSVGNVKHLGKLIKR